MLIRARCFVNGDFLLIKSLGAGGMASLCLIPEESSSLAQGGSPMALSLDFLSHASGDNIIQPWRKPEN